MSNWLGGKPIVVFTKLLCIKVAIASQLLQCKAPEGFKVRLE